MNRAPTEQPDSHAARCSREADKRADRAIAMLCAAIFAVLCCLPAHAQTVGTVVRVPLTIDYLTLGEALKRQVYTQPGGSAVLWTGSNSCQYLVAQNPVFSSAGESDVKLETQAQLSLGMSVGGTCISPISWKGIIEAEAAPYIAPGMMLRFHVTDLNLYNEQHQKTLIAGRGFDLVKRYFIPEFEGFGFDLNPATRDLAALAEEAAPPDVADRVRAALATLRAEPNITVLAGGVGATLDITLPFVATPVPSAAPTPAPLTPAEVAAFQKTLDEWDAFLVFAIKQLGETHSDPILRDQLFNLLLDSRYRLVAALANPASGGPDPVRILFLHEWRRLGEIIRGAAHRGTLGDRSLEFLSFISAGDALFALDEAAPALGMRISAADLRRLARIMAPGVKTDPLAFSYAEDPELRRMFGFTGEPLHEAPAPSPAQSPSPAGVSSPSPAAASSPTISPTSSPASSPMLSPIPSPPPTPAPAASPSASPATSPTHSPTATPRASATAAPSPTPQAKPSASSTPAAQSVPAPSPSSGLSSWLDVPIRLLSPASACAAEPQPRASSDPVPRNLIALGNSLRRAVVTDENARVYHDQMRELLDLSALHTLVTEQVPARYRAMYQRLVKSVAWQESCWRQFVLKNGRVTWLESSTGDIGLMQVNRRVWRGFYNIRMLEWDVVYNASAGSEILAHLMLDFSNSRRARAGYPGALARSTYAAYNGGPSKYLRWRGRESRVERLIDRSFWDKYQAVAHGKTIDILSCATQWGKTPAH